MTSAPVHKVILASAGTGKTFALTSRFLELLAAGELPERILATTFTRKAAGEILRKIVERLSEGAASGEKAAKLGAQIGRPGLTPEGCVRLLTGMARSLDRLAVGTIDSFFAKLAAGYALTIGGRSWRVIDQDEDAALKSEAVSRALHAGDREELLGLLRQRAPGQAGHAVHADLLVAVDTAYQQFLSSDREAWAAFNPSPGPGAEVVSRAMKALEELKAPLTAKGAADKRWVTAMSRTLECAREGDWKEFLETSLVEKIVEGKDSFARVQISGDVLRAINPLIEHAGAVRLGQLRERTLATWDMLSRFDVMYRGLKESRGLCTFDDVPRMLLEHSAGGEGGSLEEMYYRLDARIKHVLLDEFQDTSVVQWRLLEPLVGEIVSQEGDRSLLCVGDVKQSLYGWRNAEPELLESITKRWPQVVREDAVGSYRSSPVVIDAVNEVMGGLGRNDAFAGRAGEGGNRALDRWARMFKAHTTNRPELRGYCRVTAAPGGEDAAERRDAALGAAADRVKWWCSEAPGRSIGVLFRNGAEIAAMKHELAAREITASEEGGNPLADTPVVAAVLSLLVLTDHPANTAAIFHAASSPLGKVVGLEYGRGSVSVVASAIRTRLLSEGFAGVIEGWVRRLAPDCSAQDLGRLDQLVSLAVRFDERSATDPTTRAGAFVEFVRQQRVEDPSAAPVRLMTMHAAKGLEFDIVVLPVMDAPFLGRPPSVIEMRDPADPLAPASMLTLFPGESLVSQDADLLRMYEGWRERRILEEVCVLYVALTRAKHAIEMFVTPSDKSVSEEGTTITFEKIVRGEWSPGAAPAGSVLWTSGDERWHEVRAGDDVRPAPTLVSPAATEIPTVNLALDEIERTRHLRRATPSGEGLSSGGAGGGWPGLELDGAIVGRKRGVLFHAWFELIRWLEDGIPTDAELMVAAARAGVTVGGEAGRLMAEFRGLLGRSPARDVLSRGWYSGGDAELYIEAPFVQARRPALGATELLAGRIDRLVVVRDGAGAVQLAHVVDFKTDLLTDETPEGVRAHAEHYAGQMGAYREAVAALLGCAKSVVRTTLLFVTHDRMMDV